MNKLTPTSPHQKSSLEHIEALARVLSEYRAVLSERISALQAELAALQKEHLPRIRKTVNTCAGLHLELQHLVRVNPSAFEKPRTRIFHGIKLGYAKQKGSIEIEDPQRTVQLIERHYADNPDLLALLIHVEKTPRKKGIEDLPVADAKKIGCEVIGDTDTVIVKPVDGEVEKLVNALLKSATEE